MVRGYPRRAGVRPGERLVLHVATDAPRFRAVVHRWADGFVRMGESSWFPGRDAPSGEAAHDWDWPAYELDIPRDWPSGVYIAHLEEEGAPMLTLATSAAAALFVVRGDGSAPLLYRVPLATYHAYNCTGGGCFYNHPTRSHDPPGSRVTFLRPGGGIGGDTWGAIDYYDPASPRQTFAHWDAPFIRWLSRQGIAADFCTDLDLHDDPGLLSRYRMLLSVGHDEYWTEAMRDGVESYVESGGNAAFFGANVCWWRIHLVDRATAMVCHQGGPDGAFDHWWAKSGPRRPEDSLTGVSYRHGGGWWDGARRTSGFVVQDASHWVFDGTGLANGDAFGADTSPPLVGYECDGAPVERVVDGRFVLAANAPDCGTPPGLGLLAVGVLDAEWQERPPREGMNAHEGVHAATMAMHARGRGRVFTAGTTDWAQVLACGEPRVERITRNVIARLSSSAAGSP